MKIAFCLYKYFPYGGLQRDFLKIAQEAKNRGHEIHVFTMQWQGEFIDGFTLRLLKSRGLQNHSRCYEFSKQLAKILQQEAFDVVVGFNKMPHLDFYYAADVCYQARMKNRSLFNRLLPRYHRWLELERSVFNHAAKTKILLIAEKQQKEFMHYYQTSAERFYLLPPGISKDRKRPSDADAIRKTLRKELNLQDHEFLLLMVGSGFKTKGVDRSLRALSALHQDLRIKCKLMIIGDDNAKPFMQLAKQLKINDRVTFLGGRDDVPAFLLAADLLLHPAYHENTGTVLLEAVVSGLPVLTTDVCGYAEYIVKANCGKVLASPFSLPAMIDALTSMLQSNERPIWRQNALNFAEDADIYDMAAHAVDVILGNQHAVFSR